MLLPPALLVTLGWFGLRCFGPNAAARPQLIPSWKDRTLRSLAAALLLAGLAVASTLLLAPHLAPPPLSGEDVGPVQGVGDVLREELPMPPQPLPPELFTSTGSFDLEHADRDWAKLEPRFRRAVLQVFTRIEARGYRMALLEGFRSPERQELLARRGPAVTRARAGQSRHQSGLAADVAPMRDGRLSLLDQDPWTVAAYQ
ncbi:MAG TPA: M15 family metallopeptidase, partial [Holophaga sp.]|nr:M15 family metallopeptidase [Holophaga sp.]